MNIPLPKGVKITDTQRKYSLKDGYAPVDRAMGDCGSVTMHYTERFGWCIATLPISKSQKFADRTYGICVNDKGIVRVGKGPHVLSTITLYFKQKRAEMLAHYAELYKVGLVRAHEIRDGISTRRAQTSDRYSFLNNSI